MLNFLLFALTMVMDCDSYNSAIRPRSPEMGITLAEEPRPYSQDGIIKAAMMIFTRFHSYQSRGVINLNDDLSKNGTLTAKHFLQAFIIGNKMDDVKLDFRQLVMKYGFKYEEHIIKTEDGYILTLFRIPSKGPAVFLMHGFLGSSDDFIVAGEGSALGYLLARSGYDVWFGNARGNKYSRRHYTIETNDSSFWDFSWHEIGIYDLPSMITYVLNVTNQTKIKYVGYSQGCTTLFVMLSEKPEFNKKISIVIALSPVALMTNVKSPILKLLSPIALKLPTLARNLGVHEFLPNNELIELLKRAICGKGTIIDVICSNPLFLVFGLNYSQLNATNLPVIFGHLPAGASVKQFAHYCQGLVSGDFKFFDYGTNENMEKYASLTPPIYKLQNVLVPVSMFFSDSDWFADPRDVAFLSYRLKNVVDIYKVPYKGFSHLDFIIAKDVVKLVYARILKLLMSFQS